MNELYSLNPLSVFGETLDNLNLELEKIRRRELEGFLIRTHCTWIEEGVKPTWYFCGLEKRQDVNKSITKISNTEGKIITNQEDILEEVKYFYINLYENKDLCLEDED